LRVSNAVVLLEGIEEVANTTDSFSGVDVKCRRGSMELEVCTQVHKRDSQLFMATPFSILLVLIPPLKLPRLFPRAS
jgi:hypothetical protein